MNFEKIKFDKGAINQINEPEKYYYEYKLFNSKPYEYEPYVLNYNNIRTSVRYEIGSINIPGKISENYSTTWEEIGKKLLNNDDFGGYYKKTNAFKKEILPNLISGLESKQEIAAAILAYVQNNFSWNEYYGKYASQSLNKTIKTKVGNVADINLLLVAMLREAGIDADPVVLSSVPNGRLNYMFPSISKLDYVIASFYEDSKLYLMDATNKFSQINQLPQRVLNYRGFYIDDHDTHEVDLINTTVSTNITSNTFSFDSDFSIHGTLSNTQTNYDGMNEIEKYNDDKKQYESNFRKQYSFPLDSLEIKTEKGILKTSFNYHATPEFESLGNKIVFNPLLFLATKEQKFKASSRTNLIELESPRKIVKIVRFKIPQGYKVENLPLPKRFKIVNDAGEYIYTVKQTEDNNIEVRSSFTMYSFVLPAEYFSVLKEFYEKIIESEGQLLSLIPQS